MDLVQLVQAVVFDRTKEEQEWERKYKETWERYTLLAWYEEEAFVQKIRGLGKTARERECSWRQVEAKRVGRTGRVGSTRQHGGVSWVGR